MLDIAELPCCGPLNDASMGAVGAGKVVAVADGPVYAELKPSLGGGVGVAGPLGPGVVDDIADRGFGS